MEERQKKFERLIKLKQQAAEIRQEEAELKDYFKSIAEGELIDTNGLGSITILPDTGNGIKFSEKKGSPSVTKLKELGLTKEQIDSTKGVYIAMEIF